MLNKVWEKRYTGTHNADIAFDGAILLAYSDARESTLDYAYLIIKTGINSHVRSAEAE